MAGTIVADDIQHSTAGSVGTEYVVDGTVKSYGMIDGTGTVNFRTSFNTSSVTDNGTGDYTLNINNNMNSSTYMFIIDSHNETTGHSDRGATKYTNGHAAGSFRFTVGYASNTSGGGAKYDEDYNPIAILGDLA